MLLFRAAVFALMLAAVTKGASACSCTVSGAVCGAPMRADRMFVGRVLRVRTVGNEHRFPDGRVLLGGGKRHFTFVVTEDLSENYSAGQEVEVVTGMGGGDCGYNFEVGKSYLVDPYRDADGLATGICSRTLPIGAAGALIHEFRQTRAGGSAPALIGTVVYRSGVPGVPVTLREASGTVSHAITDSSGVYEVQSLPPGEYTASFGVPTYLSTEDGGEKPASFTVAPSGTVNKVCRIDLFLYTKGALDGQIVDGSGHGVAGFVSAYTHAPDCKPPGLWSAASSTDANGNFHLHPLEDGNYWLYLTPRVGEKGDWYYPGVREPAAAISVEVKDGEPTTGLIVQIHP